MSDAARHMDGIYRTQRHIYDLTRKPYLLGRDILIRDLKVLPGGRVLEIGCGTARNLIRIADRYPHSVCYGIDISEVMLETARQSLDRRGLDSRVRVAWADATHFDPALLFDTPLFDRVVISYALSMIPQWQVVVEAALSHLAEDGSLHIVDFGDQSAMPVWFARTLHAWLRLFSVEPRMALPQELQRIAVQAQMRAEVRPIYRGYATLAEVHARRSLAA